MALLGSSLQGSEEELLMGMVFERHFKSYCFSKFPHLCSASGVVIFHHRSLEEVVILGLSLKSKDTNK